MLTVLRPWLANGNDVLTACGVGIRYAPLESLNLRSIRRFGLNWQAEFARNWVLEVGYVGTRGTHLLRYRSLNQALSTSPEHPLRGAIANTVGNVGLRVPVQGVPPNALTVVESAGTSWYNGLEVNLNKPFGKALDGLISYTFPRLWIPMVGTLMAHPQEI